MGWLSEANKVPPELLAESDVQEHVDGGVDNQEEAAAAEEEHMSSMADQNQQCTVMSFLVNVL